MSKSKTKKLQIITKKVGQVLEEELMENELSEMQKIVGGHIEAFGLPNKITMWLDEEGLLKEKDPNLVIRHQNRISHVIVGDIFFTSIDESGETISLNRKQKEWLFENITPHGILERKENGSKFLLFSIEL